MTTRYPVALDLAGRRVLVVGGGPVAARRVRGLTGAGADVHVVAPAVCQSLADLIASARVTWHPRPYADGDADGAWLVHTATGDPVVDGAVAAAAQAARVWCVRADDACRSTAWTPAVARVGDVTVAVTGSVTSGADPGRARAVRDAIRLLLETGQLPVRPRRREKPGATTDTPGGGGDGGWVALVGGGPGDPGLITVRGRQLLAQADVVVVDRLAPRALLDTLEDGVEVVEAGKDAYARAPSQELTSHGHISQGQINDILVSRALAGCGVVRLKGGDPFVFGRGGEELLACATAGVPCLVVPGVTSAVAVPAAAGIPVTHRGLSRQLTVVSGHDDLDWPRIAALEGTLVVLMGASRLEMITSRLMEHGRAASTPAAVVESGWTADQHTTRGELGTIAELTREHGVRPPAVLVVGDVVRLAAFAHNG